MVCAWHDFSDAFLSWIYSWAVLLTVSWGSPLVVVLGHWCEGVVNSQRIYALRWWWEASVSLLLVVVIQFLFDDVTLIWFLLNVSL